LTPHRRLLGSISLLEIDWKRREGQVAFWLARDARGRGVAARAIERIAEWAGELDLLRITASVEVTNEASQLVLERARFVRERAAPANRTLHGQCIDEYIYARDVSFTRRQELRVTFDEVATLYHRARRRYPESLFSDIFEVTGLEPPARLLEIGAGTGIATTVLAERGFDVVGVELGEEMARAARANLAHFAAVEIVTGAFESYSSDELFDAALAFSAFHWIDANVRYGRTASLLTAGGFLVVADARYSAPDE
jgi:2-polyprenyl-3-methyl-5-hydroxy-6-metoxy-1,4-benzoquinol methylase